MIGVEALVRWHHPTRGIVSPAEFIPAAERTGLIVPLGRFVLRETCRQAAAWLAEFGPDALQKAGPNVSARQLHDPDFVSDVTAALADSGLPSDRLVLEVTESAVLRGQQVSRTLHELDGMGIQLALDDFGTGESSLSLLRAFPAAIVKLDKSFVDGIEIDDGEPAAARRPAGGGPRGDPAGRRARPGRRRRGHRERRAGGPCCASSATPSGRATTWPGR